MRRRRSSPQNLRTAYLRAAIHMLSRHRRAIPFPADPEEVYRHLLPPLITAERRLHTAQERNLWALFSEAQGIVVRSAQKDPTLDEHWSFIMNFDSPHPDAYGGAFEIDAGHPMYEPIHQWALRATALEAQIERDLIIIKSICTECVSPAVLKRIWPELLLALPNVEARAEPGALVPKTQAVRNSVKTTIMADRLREITDSLVAASLLPEWDEMSTWLTNN